MASRKANRGHREVEESFPPDPRQAEKTSLRVRETPAETIKRRRTEFSRRVSCGRSAAGTAVRSPDDTRTLLLPVIGRT